MVTSKAKGLLQYDLDHNHVTQTYLSVKSSIVSISNRQFFILVANTTKHKVLRRLIDVKSTTVSEKTPQKSSQDEESLSNVIRSASTEKESSPSTSQKQKPTGCRKSWLPTNTQNTKTSFATWWHHSSQ